MSHSAPEFLTDLYDISATIARENGLDDERADAMALQIIDKLRPNWEGTQPYFAKGLSMKLRERDLKIYQEFTGNNHSELAVKYNVSRVWVYAIIKQVDAEVRRRAREGQQPLL